MVARAMVLAVVLGASATASRADPKIDEAKTQVEAADIDFKLARFTYELDKNTRAYALYPTPPLLFKIAQGDRILKKPDKPPQFFPGYFREEPNASNRAGAGVPGA